MVKTRETTARCASREPWPHPCPIAGADLVYADVEHADQVLLHNLHVPAGGGGRTRHKYGQVFVAMVLAPSASVMRTSTSVGLHLAGLQP